jgi:hypothetical protein
MIQMREEGEQPFRSPLQVSHMYQDFREMVLA